MVHKFFSIFSQVPNRLLESQAIEPITHFLVMAGQVRYLLPPRISNSPVVLDPLIFG
jgi:hypothetical protein